MACARFDVHTCLLLLLMLLLLLLLLRLLLRRLLLLLLLPSPPTGTCHVADLKTTHAASIAIDARAQPLFQQAYRGI